MGNMKYATAAAGRVEIRIPNYVKQHLKHAQRFAKKRDLSSFLIYAALKECAALRAQGWKSKEITMENA